MQQADSSPSVLKIATAAISRASIVFLGGTLAGFWLLDVADGLIRPEPSLGGFFERLGDALSPTAAVSNALGNTMYLAAVAIFIGFVLGAVVAGLARVRPFRSVLGAVTPLALAGFAPGFLLLPIAWAAITEGVIAPGPLDDGASFADSLPFVAVWGGLAGLSLIPGMASRLAAGPDGPAFGGRIASASLAARSETETAWRIGLPTTTFLVALTAAELLSGHDGLISLFRDSLELGDLITTFEIIVVFVAAGALVAAVVDAVGAASSRSADAPPPGPIRTSRATIALFGLLAIAVIVAGAGYGLDPETATDAVSGLGPTSGGPWLGTDEIGRSLAVTMAQAIGPSLIFSFLAATVAAVLGLVVATLRHVLPTALGRVLGTLIDLFWWPTVLFFPLISLAFGSPDRPEIHPGLLLISGLALTPLASRLFGRTVLPAPDSRSLRALSAWLFTSGLALSIHLVAAFMAPFGSGERTDLGRMIADGFAGYQERTWPFLLAALSATALLATLYYLAAAVAAPVRVTAHVGQPAEAAPGLEMVHPEADEHPADEYPVDKEHRSFEAYETVEEYQAVDEGQPAEEYQAVADSTPSATDSNIEDAPPMPIGASAAMDEEVVADHEQRPIGQLLGPYEPGEPDSEPNDYEPNDHELDDREPNDRELNEHAADPLETQPEDGEPSGAAAADASPLDPAPDMQSPDVPPPNNPSSDEVSAADESWDGEPLEIELRSDEPVGADPTPATLTDWTEPDRELQHVVVAPPSPPTRPAPRRKPILEAPDPIDGTIDNPDGTSGTDGGFDLSVAASRTIELRPSTIRIAVAQAEAARANSPGPNEEDPADASEGDVGFESLLDTDES